MRRALAGRRAFVTGRRLSLGTLLALGCSGGAGCGGAIAEEALAEVSRGDLVLSVELTGALQATRSLSIGPPTTADTWDFKITKMAPEGADLKRGEPLLGFDTSELDRDLRERTAERDAAAQEIERKRHDLDLAQREGELRVAEAEAAARKARLKADLPEKYTAEVEVRLAKVDLDAAEAELVMAKRRLQHALALGRAELAYLRDRHARRAARVERTERTITAMTVQAPMDGVVVYRSNWRGEKVKVGDSCWPGRGCVELTDVSDLFAKGEVDELESARVAVGQKARLRLEALPELEWTGAVASLRPNVYRQSPRTPLKVIGVDVKLDRVEPGRLRPGMQFRGRLETERLTGALLVPADAVFARPSGPTVFRRSAAGWERITIEIGRRTRTQVEVRRGLAEGDRIARRDLDAAGESVL